MRSGFSSSNIFANAFAITKGSGFSSDSMRIALSQPKAKAVLSCSCEADVPTVTAIISVAVPLSFNRTASSTAISQNGLTGLDQHLNYR